MTIEPRRHATRMAGPAVCISLLLAGCSGEPSPSETTSTPPQSASASAMPSTSASPVPTSALAADKQQAVDEAAAVVLRYEQMLYDILAEPIPDPNKINEVVTEPQLTLDQASLAKGAIAVIQGDLVTESTGPLTLDSVEPIKVDLKADPPVVVIEACIDPTAARTYYKGELNQPGRQLARYRVVKTTYLPAPGWAVSKVLPPGGHEQPQPC